MQLAGLAQGTVFELQIEYSLLVNQVVLSGELFSSACGASVGQKATVMSCVVVEVCSCPLCQTQFSFEWRDLEHLTS